MDNQQKIEGDMTAPDAQPAVQPAEPEPQSPTTQNQLTAEHWLLMSAGVVAWAMTRRNPSALVRTVGLAASAALATRAVGGSEGLKKVLAKLPVGRQIW